MKTEKRVGFVLNPQDDPKSWKLGATELPKVVLRPDGEWEDFLPIKESQTAGGYETWSCTVQGTENAQQILEKFHFGETKEYDERYSYNLAGINPPGADPHDVAEVFRLKGVVSGLYPIPDTYEEYATPRPVPNNVQNQGIKHPYELRHQWLWRWSVSKEKRIELIREHLKYSPLGVSVTAWNKEKGVYVDNGQPNTHWTIIYGEEKGKGWKVFDSYSPHKKILSYDHNIEVCKRYQLVPSVRQIRMSLLQRIALLLKELLEGVMPPQAYDQDPKELPMNQPDVKPITPREELYNLAKSWLGKDASPKNFAPSDLACAESVSTLLSLLTPFPIITGTWSLMAYLNYSSKFTKITIDELEKGDVLLYATGTVKNAKFPGHVFIVGETHLMSNDSKTGLWGAHYTLATARKRWETAGFSPNCYRLNNK